MRKVNFNQISYGINISVYILYISQFLFLIFGGFSFIMEREIMEMVPKWQSLRKKLKNVSVLATQMVVAILLQYRMQTVTVMIVGSQFTFPMKYQSLQQLSLISSSEFRNRVSIVFINPSPSQSPGGTHNAMFPKYPQKNGGRQQKNKA